MGFCIEDLALDPSWQDPRAQKPSAFQCLWEVFRLERAGSSHVQGFRPFLEEVNY